MNKKISLEKQRILDTMSEKEMFFSHADESEVLTCIKKTRAIKKIRAVYYLARRESKIQRLAMIKWKELSLKKVLRANTFKKIKILYLASPKNSEAKRLAIQKWLAKCITQEQLKDVLDSISRDSRDRYLALKKMKGLC